MGGFRCVSCLSSSGEQDVGQALEDWEQPVGSQTAQQGKNQSLS